MLTLASSSGESISPTISLDKNVHWALSRLLASVSRPPYVCLPACVFLPAYEAVCEYLPASVAVCMCFCHFTLSYGITLQKTPRRGRGGGG